MSSASGWGGVSTEDALAGAVAFSAAMRAGQDSSGEDATDLARDVLDAIAKWNAEPDAPPHLAHEWGCLTEAERADVLAWAAGQVRAVTLRPILALADEWQAMSEVEHPTPGDDLDVARVTAISTALEECAQELRRLAAPPVPTGEAGR